jgi:hypothetical protein
MGFESVVRGSLASCVMPHAHSLSKAAFDSIHHRCCLPVLPHCLHSYNADEVQAIITMLQVSGWVVGGHKLCELFE